MSNFGFTDMRLVSPYDVAFREARSAVKAGYILQKAEVCSSVAEAVADCALIVGSTAADKRDLHLPLHRLETAVDLVRSSSSTTGIKIALLFGSEKFGLSNADMSHCHWLFRIPTRAEHGSMNLGQAVAITLYELSRKTETAAHERFPAPQPPSGEDLERIHNALYRLLSNCGYIPARTSESSSIKLRQLIMRLGISSSDARTWQGILRQLQWKIDQTNTPK